MDNNKELSKTEQVLQIVTDGSKSEYWKLLKGVILQWKKEEQFHLDSFEKRGVSSKTIEEYNRSVDKMKQLDKFLSINEKIISYNNSIILRMKSLISSLIPYKHHIFLGVGKY